MSRASLAKTTMSKPTIEEILAPKPQAGESKGECRDTA
jgi:hypothetical protein